MLTSTVIIISYLTIVYATNHETSPIKIDEKIFRMLRLSPDRLSKLTSYEEFEVFKDFQCAIECIKDRSHCNGYAFNEQTSICSLFDGSDAIVDENLTKLRERFQRSKCDEIQCKSDAICIENETPICLCLNGQPTPDNCDQIEIGTWAEYDEWSKCSATCGEGYQYRKRECLSVHNATRKISAEYCIGKSFEIKQCDVKSCPVYGPWTTWTPCSTFCGIGAKQRNRSCIPPGSTCGNYTFEQRACGEAHCQRVPGIKETEPDKYPMKGYLAIREGDILCIPKNSSGVIKHMADIICKAIGFSRGAQYAILNPISNSVTCYPGILCDGTESNFYECKYDPTHASADISELFAIIARCVVDGGFSHWSDWSTCTKTCGTGEKTRSRTCTEPLPAPLEPEISGTDPTLVGANCTGEYVQVRNCNEQPC